MRTLISSIFKAVGSLFVPGMFAVMIFSVIITIAALFGFIAVVTMLSTLIADTMQGSAIAVYIPWIGGVGASILAWILFPGIMPLVISFFDVRIASLIERHDYPFAGNGREPGFLPELLHDIRFALIAIGLNILALPLYLLPIIGIVLFYALNGYLLGREFFVMVARRHITLNDAHRLRKANSRIITLSGAALTLCATIPIVNLFAPFWGIALMTHIYHALIGPKNTAILLPK